MKINKVARLNPIFFWEETLVFENYLFAFQYFRNTNSY
jgi:hypothetical protein